LRETLNGDQIVKTLFASASLLALLSFGAAAAEPVPAAQIADLARAWDHAQFEIPGKAAKIAEFQRLEGEATRMERQYPEQAEPLVWEAIIVSSSAGVEGGLGALGKVTHAREVLERAERINPNALGDGSIYTSLGSLYYQVPGFPIGFGNKDRARAYLQRALAVNPDGIEPNYFMADFLAHQGDYAHAGAYLTRAAAAPPRSGREIADQGRRRDIAVLQEQVREHGH
jgi:tetratricopeptide (TPR) repeat protein